MPNEVYCTSYVVVRIDANLRSAHKPNLHPTKAGVAKARVAKLRTFASPEKDPRIAGPLSPVVYLRRENVIKTNIADVIVHVDETLTPNQLKGLEDSIHEIGGVVSACNRDNKPHLISVTYNPELVKSHDILARVKNEGVHAELVGL